jgi:hypothetical protein
MKSRVGSVALLIGSILVTGVLLDVVLRFLPVSEGLRGLPVNENNPVYRYAPNRELLWSKGWNFTVVNQIRTNNYGFINDRDYDPSEISPLLAVIGDSFVEAAMVPYNLTVAGLLDRLVAGRGRVYSFGSSGAALSQYLAYAQYVRDEFHPVGMVIIIVGNDFDQSLMKYRSHPGFHYFVEQQDGRLALQRIDRSISWWKDALVMSRLALYVIMNLEAPNLLERLAQWASLFQARSPQFVGNVDSTPEPGRVSDSKRAVDEFLARLPEMAGLPARRIVLVVDAPRPEIYTPDRLAAVQNSYFEIMRRYLVSEASDKGYEIIDLEENFAADYRLRGLRFEFVNDYHWNSTGHEVVAAAIQRTSMFKDLFDSSSGVN